MTILPHIAGRVFDTPLLIARAKLDTILGVLIPRLRGEPVSFGAKPAARNYEVTPHGIAIIPVYGTLVRRTVGLEAQSGLTSYACLEEQFSTAMRDGSVKAILLDIDSPGGEAGGVFDLADMIFSTRKEKPVWAVANEDAFSAAYMIAAAAEKLYLPRTAGAGSIGVIAVHLDQSQAEEDAGLKYTAIYAGERKNDLSPHEPLTDPARSQLQAEVNRIYDIFSASVSRMRGLDIKAVKGTEAALFFGEQAITAGLADRIGTFSDALSDLTQKLSRPAIRPTPNLKRKDMKIMDNDNPTPAQEPQTPDIAAIRAEAFTEARTEVLAYVSEINELCLLAGVPQKAMDFITKAVPLAEVRKALLEAKAATADATAIAGQIPVNASPANAESKIDTAGIYAKRNQRKEK